MKKLLFFKSSSSHGAEHHDISAAAREKRHRLEKRWKTLGSENVENKLKIPQHFFPVSERKVTERKTLSRTRSLILRSRSLSMSSAADDDKNGPHEDLNEFRNQRKFSSSSRGASTPLCDCSDCYFQFTDRDLKPERNELSTIQMPSGEALYDHDCCGPSYSSPPRSSLGSAPIPHQVLDLYIDGEQHQERFRIRENRPSDITSFSGGNSAKQKSDSSSSSNLFFPSHDPPRDPLKFGRRHESPGKLAKDVVERLLRLEQCCSSTPREICSNWPSMPSTSCDKQLDGHSYSLVSGPSENGSTHKDINDGNILDFNKQTTFLKRQYRNLFSEQKEDNSGSLLGQKLEEAKERAMLLTRELAQERSFQYNTGNVMALSQMVRNLLEQERDLVLEISEQLQCRIAERRDAKEAVSLVKEEMNSVIVKLEREKDELQSCLHKELDRRTNDWEIKLREFQSEECRLRDRLRELAEKNVSLQKEISSFYYKEKEYTDSVSRLDLDVKDITAKMDVARSENDILQKNLSEIQDKLKVAEEFQSCTEMNYKEKERENLALIKAVARLQGTCSEQERIIDGLRQSLNLEIEKQHASGKLEDVAHKLQMEQLRLTGVEQVLRRQLETCTVEANSLRHENIYLLERLKAGGKVGGPSALKLDQELVTFVQCLQKGGLSLLNESIQTSAKLLGVLQSKSKTGGFLEEYSLIEYDMKVRGFKQGVEQLARNLGKAASVLNEIAEPANCEPELSEKRNENSSNVNRKISEDDLNSELKAEGLLTSLLREKLYSKEKEIENLQADLARASRNHDVLKGDIQDAYDTVSCVNHKMKNLELQMIKKDGTINQLQGKVRSLEEELSATRGILSKVTQERDLMWEEVKQYSEKNMLLNLDINSLKKKIEALEEDTLLKDGQISILKDSLNNAKSFDVLFSCEHGESFNI